MTRFGKLISGFGGVALLATLPMLLGAAGPTGTTQATHFVSSGRAVNTIADMSAAEQSQARAQIWALTGRTNAPTCSNDASCFELVQTQLR